MRVLFALPGLHRYNRGAEIAFISVARELAGAGDAVTLMGSGPVGAADPYRFLHAASVRRENFERFRPISWLRNEYAYEELTFVPALLNRYRPSDYDITLTCSYPFTNWVLRRPTFGHSRPPHVFVTQNGDWPAQSSRAENKYFGCDGLVCTNPEFYERNKDRWRCRLIPNGADGERFHPGPPQRGAFGLPPGDAIVLMVSALIPSKRVGKGIEAVSRLPNAHLVVAGDGPLCQELEELAAKLMPGRYTRLSVPFDRMPDLYRSSNVFLHLSKDEPSSLAIVEAMACGLPVIAHDAPRMRFIAGDDEFLMDTENPGDIAAQISRALSASPDLVKTRAMRAAAFSWKSIAQMYRSFLRELVAERQSQGR